MVCNINLSCTENGVKNIQTAYNGACTERVHFTRGHTLNLKKTYFCYWTSLIFDPFAISLFWRWKFMAARRGLTHICNRIFIRCGWTSSRSCFHKSWWGRNRLDLFWSCGPSPFWHHWFFFLLKLIFKGQIFLKGLLVSSNPPKKRTNKCVIQGRHRRGARAQAR